MGAAAATGQNPTAQNTGQSDGQAASAAAAGQAAAAGEKTGEQKTGEQAAGDPGKSAGDKAGEQSGAAAAAAATAKGSKDGGQEGQPKAPAKYELKLSDGHHLDAGELPAFEAIARERDLTNEQAQAFIDSIVEQRKATTDRFFAEAQADPDYGGDKLPESQRLARAVLDRFRPVGTPRGDALRKVLDREGYGNNIHLLGLLTDIGRAMQEDTPAGRTNAGGAGSSEAEQLARLYPTMKQ